MFFAAGSSRTVGASVRKLRLLATLLLGFIGCGYGPHDRITFDPCQPLEIRAPADASPNERESIVQAIALWNRLGVARLTTDESVAAPVVPIIFQLAAPAFFGVYEDRVGEIFINRQITLAHARAVIIAHEIGHAFGLEHVEKDQRASVMNKGNADTEPTQEDGHRLAALGVECK